MKISRRKFFNRAVSGTAAMVSIPAIVTSGLSVEKKTQKKKYTIFDENDVVLFQGDSITDAGREKEKELPNSPDSFGYGYAFLAASELLNELPEKQLKIYNRGISGNKVFQLADRWEKDCLSLNPDVLSILIGINDYWHMRDGHYDGTIEVYERDYRKLLERTKQNLPDIKLVIGEPFAVVGASTVDETWMEPVAAYQRTAKKMAEEFDAIWVPYQKVFDEAVKHAPANYWTHDGVHPSMAGAELMAEAWLRAVQ